MTTSGTGNSREGKYCPRCRTMTFRDREVCEHCGHQFRTGLGAPPLDAPITDEATLHRTMQFTLPPLPPREGVVVPKTPPVSRGMAAQTRGRGLALFALAAVGVGLALAVWVYFRGAETARAANPSPAGVWETTPTDRASEDARLRLTLRADGGGLFSWEANSSASPRSSPAPLRWRLDPDGRLVLSIAPTPTDVVPGTLITILDSHPWLWRVDRPRHRLIIGNLSFTEKGPP